MSEDEAETALWLVRKMVSVDAMVTWGSHERCQYCYDMDRADDGEHSGGCPFVIACEFLGRIDRDRDDA